MAKRRKFKSRKAQKRVMHRKGQNYVKSKAPAVPGPSTLTEAIQIIANRMGKRGD